MSDNLHFEDDIRQGEEYQDFIQHELAKRGMTFLCNTSRKYQWQEGESFGGLEIKYDRLMYKTGNVFIETEAESKDKTHFIEGGIYKKDNAWLFLIGDYKEAFLFSKYQLQKMWETQKDVYVNSGYIIPKEQSYSKGFLITRKMLENSSFVLNRFIFERGAV